MGGAWVCFGDLHVLGFGSFPAGFGLGSAEAQSVSDLKFQMSCHGHWAKKNSFFRDDKGLESKCGASYNVL
jgi:hypothetical protein